MDDERAYDEGVASVDDPDQPLVLGTAGQSTASVDDPDQPLVLGTAGHIDHGKTALVTLLTGRNTDRLREERERGISIELGYAELELPSGRRLGVVDVPGHERFVRTMVAGATGIDLFLLVVAADDAVMPQTVEHLAILELLGVPTGVVALTKADLVDDELLALAEEDIAGFLADTAYAGAPIVTVSSRDGRGIPELLGALEQAAAGLPPRHAQGPARLAIDRVFTLKGIGTVVTGTLWRGRISAGDALRVEPGGVEVAARSVEVHDAAAGQAVGGQRTGVNVRGGERASLERGRWLISPSSPGAVTRQLDAWVRLLPGVRLPRAGERLRFHHGTAQHVARLAFLDRKEPSGGEAVPVTVRLDDQAYVEPGDRFILRSLSPTETIGGGSVLDASPVHWHDRSAHAGFLLALHSEGRADAVRRLAGERGDEGLGAEDFAYTTLGVTDAGDTLRAVARSGRLEELTLPSGARRWFPAGTLARLSAALIDGLRGRAAERPEKPTLTLAELAALLPRTPSPVIETLTAALVEGGSAVVTEGGVAAAQAGVLNEAQEAEAGRLAASVAAARFAPPTLALLVEQAGLSRRDVERLLAVLVRRGELVRVKEDLWFSAAAVDDARRLLAETLESQPQITLAEFRDALTTGRRNAQALLEHFDGEGLTRRVGEARVLRRRR